MKPLLSIIIPVYQETAGILATLHHLCQLSFPFSWEIVVSDGEPARTTISHIANHAKNLLTKHKLTLVSSVKGRGPQLNAGAQKSCGQLLLFLHADTLIDQKAVDSLAMAYLKEKRTGRFCGAFDLRIRSSKKGFRMIEKTASYRSRITRIPYGDQGIFMSRNLFDRIGGYPDTPIMEDVGIMSRIKALNIPPVFIPRPVSTSARRWETEGVIYTTCRNWVLISLYLAGVSPGRLARFY